MACPTEGLCVGEIEGNNVACQLNVGTGLGLLSSHSTSLPYLYAVEYAHAYMKEILLRGQPFMRLRKKSVVGQHSVRCILLRVAKDPPDFSVIHMYKSLCVRAVGADAKFRSPMTTRADDQYCDYRTFFYDDAPMHPLNKESIYDLDARTPCTVSGLSVAKYLVINSYKYEYARSIPAELPSSGYPRSKRAGHDDSRHDRRCKPSRYATRASARRTTAILPYGAWRGDPERPSQRSVCGV
jgi:hypothetical protein